jgi:hypothetical protein
MSLPFEALNDDLFDVHLGASDALDGAYDLAARRSVQQ